jgi:hypothetical protein
MAEGNVFGIYGIKAFALVNRSTGVPYGRYRVLGGGEISMSADKVALMGGAQRFSWATEWGVYDTEISMTVREYPEFGYRMLLQGSSVINTAESSGNVGALANKYGTSVAAGTTGISVALLAGGSANLKTGQYTAIALGTGTIDVYYIGSQSDSYENSTLKITASPLSLPGGAATANLTSYGLQFTSRAAGSSNFNVGDTATFTVRKVNSGNEQIAIGRAAETVTEFTAYLFGEDQKTGDQFYVEIPRCSASGLPIKMTEKEYSESDVTLSFDYDSTLDYALKIYNLKG